MSDAYNSYGILHLSFQRFPPATLLAAILVALILMTFLVMKIFFDSADSSRATSNEYELVIFRPPSLHYKHPSQGGQNSHAVLGGKIFENTEVRKHNAKAFAESSLDLNKLLKESSTLFKKTYLKSLKAKLEL